MKRTFWIGLAALGLVGAAAAAAPQSRDGASMGCHGMQGKHDGDAAAGHSMPHGGGMHMMGMMGLHGMQGMHGRHGMHHSQAPAQAGANAQDRTPEMPRHRH